MDEPKNLVAQILPKTLAGLAAWMLIFAAGVASSGVVLFFYYRYQLERVEREVTVFRDQFEKDFRERSEEFKELVESSKAEIEKAAGGAGSQTSEVTQLLEKVGGSIAQIRGKDPSGAASSGSGFVVTSDDGESWILTSFQVVAGNAAEKSLVSVRIGQSERQAAVFSWDDRADLALIILRVGRLPSLPDWADPTPAPGSRVWAVFAAPGPFGAAAAQGTVLGASANGLLTDADVPSHAAGGVLIDRQNRVLGVLSLSYAPEGYSPSNGWAVPIRLSCRRVLRCPS